MSVDISPCAKLFDFAEASALIPLISKITQRHRLELEPIQQRLNMMLSNDPRRSHVEQRFEQVVSRWKSKIEKLGASVYSLWVVEFDVGDGVLCWRCPELQLAYFRYKGKAFTSRIKVSNYIKEFDPDWAH